MSKLVIKDLADSIDLDRDAMTAIVGGARVRGGSPAQIAPSTTRVVDFPETLPRTQRAIEHASQHSTGAKRVKRDR